MSWPSLFFTVITEEHSFEHPHSCATVLGQGQLLAFGTYCVLAVHYEAGGSFL